MIRAPQPGAFLISYPVRKFQEKSIIGIDIPHLPGITDQGEIIGNICLIAVL